MKDILKELMKLEKMNVNDDLHKAIQKGMKEKVSISIEKDENGNAHTQTKGTTIGILVTLAGLEKTILNECDVPNYVWETIKESIGATDNE